MCAYLSWTALAVAGIALDVTGAITLALGYLQRTPDAAFEHNEVTRGEAEEVEWMALFLRARTAADTMLGVGLLAFGFVLQGIAALFLLYHGSPNVGEPRLVIGAGLACVVTAAIATCLVCLVRNPLTDWYDTRLTQSLRRGRALVADLQDAAAAKHADASGRGGS